MNGNNPYGPDGIGAMMQPPLVARAHNAGGGGNNYAQSPVPAPQQSRPQQTRQPRHQQDQWGGQPAAPPPQRPGPQAQVDPYDYWGNQILGLQQTVQEQMSLIHNLQQRFELYGQNRFNTGAKVDVNWPLQRNQGATRYPELLCHPQIIQRELLTSNKEKYGTTDAKVFTTLNLGSGPPRVLKGFMATLHKPSDVEGNTGLLDTFLPLSSMSRTFIDTAVATQVYEGRDFFWRWKTASNERRPQDGWQPSAIMDGWQREGWFLPCEYELRDNDSITIEATPIGPGPSDPTQTWELNFYLLVYEMITFGERKPSNL